MNRLLPALLLLAGATLSAETRTAVQATRAEHGMPKIDAEHLPNLPWHMMNLWWDIPATADFQSLDIDVRIKGEVDPAKLNLYIAPIGIGQFNEVNFYGGIQSNIGGYAVSEESPT